MTKTILLLAAFLSPSLALANHWSYQCRGNEVREIRINDFKAKVIRKDKPSLVFVFSQEAEDSKIYATTDGGATLTAPLQSYSTWSIPMGLRDKFVVTVSGERALRLICETRPTFDGDDDLEP